MKTEKKLSPKKRSLIDFLRIYGVGVLLVCIILVFAYQFVEPAPPLHFKIATADTSGVYYSIATQYQKILANQGIDLEILETKGSVQNLEILKKGDADAAFIQGGTGTATDYPDLQGLASLYFEPLWIFIRSNTTVTTIAELKNARIAVGKSGSGTQKIAMQVLEDNGINSNNSTFLSLGFEEASQKLLNGDADAVFLVTGADSAALASFLQNPSVHLFSITRAAAYTRHHSFLSYVILPEGGIDLAQNIPSEDTRLIAPAATLIIRDGLHPALIDQLLQASEKVHGKKSLLLSDTKFPSPDFLDYPLSSEAERYFKNGPPFLQRYLPFWAATLIDRLKVMLLPLIALIVPIMKILPPTYQWRIRSRIYKWYDELHTVDLHWQEDGAQTASPAYLEQLDKIENEVRQVEVPLSYAKELYTLRNHIELLRQQMIGCNRSAKDNTSK